MLSSTMKTLRIILFIAITLTLTQKASSAELPSTPSLNQVDNWESLEAQADFPHTLIAVANNSLVVGTVGSGVFHYNPNNGWALPEYGSNLLDGQISVTDLAASPEGQTIYATVHGSFNITESNPPIIIRSEDGGLTWVRSDTGLVRPYVDISLAVAVDPFHPDTVLWGGALEHAQRSLDGGSTWELINSYGMNGQINEITWSKSENGVVLIGTVPGTPDTEMWGILRSLDGAESVTRVWPTNESYNNCAVMSIAQDPFHPAVWFAGLRTSGLGLSCVWKSTDNGLTWQESAAGLENVTTISQIFADPTIENRLYLATVQSGMYRSDDGGEIWFEDMEVLPRFGTYRGFAASGNEVYTAQRGSGIYRRTQDGWLAIPRNEYDGTTEVRMQMVENEVFFIDGLLGCFESSIPPQWNPVQFDSPITEDPRRCFAVYDQDTEIRAVAVGYRLSPTYANTAVYVTHDGGFNWEMWAEQVEPKSMMWIHPDTLLFEDSPNGQYQTLTASGIEPVSQPIGYVDDWILEGEKCVAILDGEVRRSSNRCQTWTSPREAPDRPLICLAGSTDSDATMIAVGNQEDAGLYISYDGGYRWEEDPTLDAVYLVQVAMHEDHQYVTSSLEEKVYHRRGDGEWTVLSEGLYEGYIPLTLFTSPNGVIISGSAVPGQPSTYFMPHPGTGDVDEWTPLTPALRLDPPYPNPSNAMVSIQYSVPFQGATSLRIVDLLGREVAYLQDSLQTEGTFKLTWDAGNVSSGTYFIQLSHGSHTVNRPITIIK